MNEMQPAIESLRDMLLLINKFMLRAVIPPEPKPKKWRIIETITIRQLPIEEYP